MYTRTSTTLYHNGYWLIDPYGRFLGFKSLVTGWAYALDGIHHQDIDAANLERLHGNTARDGRLYAEDVRIFHTVEANCGWSEFEEARVDDIELDGYPLDVEDDFTKDHIIDALWNTYERESA